MSTLRVNNMTNVGGTGSTYASGHIVQTKHVKYETATVYSTSSYVNVVSLDITPQKNSSLISISFQFHISGVGGFRILRNGTEIWIGPFDGTGPYTYWESPNNQTSADASSPRRLASFTFIDAPSSTSLLQYTLQIRPYSTGGTSNIMICEKNTAGNLIVQEIAQ